MGLIVQKHVNIGQLIFDKKAMAYLLSRPTYPSLSYIQLACDRKEQLFIAVDEFIGVYFTFNNIKHNIVSENRTGISQKIE